MRIITTLFILFFSISWGVSKAQNWALLDKMEAYSYIHDTLNVPDVFMETMQDHGDSVFVTTMVKDSSGILFGHLSNSGEFYGKEPLLGHYYKIGLSSEYTFYDLNNTQTPTYVIHPQASMNQKWIIRPPFNDTAEVKSVLAFPVFGTLDSIKVIVFNDGLDTLVLSKNHGIIRFVAGDKKYSLFGLHDAKKGNYAPKWMDIYDFETGDEFVIREYSHSVTKGVNTTTKYTKIKILSTQKDTHLLQYTYLKLGYREDVFYHPTYSWLNTYDLTYFGPVTNGASITAQNHTFLIDVNISQCVPNTLVQTSELFNASYYPSAVKTELSEDANGRYTLEGKSYYQRHIDTNSFYDKYAFAYNGCSFFSNIGVECITVKEGLGVVKSVNRAFEHVSTFDLIAYVKNGDTVGTIPTDGYMLGMQDVKETRLHVFPNPTSDALHVESSYKIMEATLYALDGRIIKQIHSSPFTDMEIDLSDLKRGCYLLQVRDEEGRTHQQKILKM